MVLWQLPSGKCKRRNRILAQLFRFENSWFNHEKLVNWINYDLFGIYNRNHSGGKPHKASGRGSVGIIRAQRQTRKGWNIRCECGWLGCCHGHLRSILNHRKQERGGNYYYYMTAYTWFSAYYYPSRGTGFIGIIFIDMGLRGRVYRDFCNPGKSC